MTARVQGKIPRVYTRGRAEKYRRAGTEKDSARIYPRLGRKVPPRGYREEFRAYIPEAVRKSTAARVQGRIPRVYTRDRAEKNRRAGTGKGNRAYIPEAGRKSTAAREQEED